MNNTYVLPAIVALVLAALGVISLVIGVQLFTHNRKSLSGQIMFIVFCTVFVWDVGYAWMGLCYDSEFAYIPRMMALFAVFAYIILMSAYVGALSNYPRKNFTILAIIYALIAIPAYILVIQKSTISFSMTPWGYWYTSTFGIGRILQFVCILYALVFFYAILFYWKKNAHLKREKNIIKYFTFYGPIMLSGAAFDTIIPTVFKTAALPGSAVASFVSVMLLYYISEKYRALGVTTANISEYVFNEVSIPVLVFDSNGKIALYNKIANDFFDADDDGLMGKRLEDMFIDNIDKQDIKLDGTCIAKANNIICRLDTNVIRDEMGDVLFKLTFVQDMSDTQKALEMMDNGRKMAQEANKAKSNFLANMSHEIRTPMNAIIGMSDLLLARDDLSDESQKMVHNIKNAGGGLLGIINDILDVSKIEAGKYELVDGEYSLPELIHSVTTVSMVRFQESKVAFIIDASPDLPEMVYGDELRVRQIIINIVGNAAKFTHEGSVTLKIRSEKIDNKHKILIDVIDTGIGIKEEDIGKLFGSFNQVDTRRNRNVTGTGLGLALSKGLANMMNGDITVESEYNIGSEFHIVLEQGVVNDQVIGEKKAELLNKKEYIKKASKKEFVITPKPGKKVLVVDDVNMNLMVAKGLLKPYQIEVDTASSGYEAIEMVQKKDYDLVFMDHMMPGMDGVDTMHQIRNLPDRKFKDLVIVALTANAISGTKEQLISEGMQDYLAKPIERVQLRDVINKWL